MLNKSVLALLLITIPLLISCTEPSKYEDFEVEIVSVNTHSDTKAQVVYTVLNTGNKKINGWKIFFVISLEGGRQVQTSESIYYKLSPGELSNERLLEAKIPEYFNRPRNARGAHLSNIKTW